MVHKILSACLAGALLSGCHVYSGAVISGKVVDEQTGAPVSGAVVVATWEIEGGTVHGRVVGILHVQEVVTDAEGRFSLPSWGPKAVFWNSLGNAQPVIAASHEGHLFWIGGNAEMRAPSAITFEERASDWNGKTITLARVEGKTPAEIAQNTRAAEYLLHTSSSSAQLRCIWEKMPLLTAAVLERSRLVAASNEAGSGLTPEILSRGGKCSDTTELIRGHDDHKNNKNDRHMQSSYPSPGVRLRAPDA